MRRTALEWWAPCSVPGLRTGPPCAGPVRPATNNLKTARRLPGLSSNPSGLNAFGMLLVLV